MPGFKMDDYVPVNERIEQFYTAFPEGSLQSEIVELTDSRVTIKASAYRTPDDSRPGIGHSSLGIPGVTSFTKGSEIENCETSAWGRAIAALGFEVKRGIASREEVTNKQAAGEQGREAPAKTPPPTDKRALLAQIAAEHRIDHAGLEQYATLVGIQPGTRATDAQLDQLIAAVRGHGTDEPLVIEQAAEVPLAAAEPEAAEVAPVAPAASTIEEAIAKAEKRAKAVA